MCGSIVQDKQPGLVHRTRTLRDCEVLDGAKNQAQVHEQGPTQNGFGSIAKEQMQQERIGHSSGVSLKLRWNHSI